MNIFFIISKNIYRFNGIIDNYTVVIQQLTQSKTYNNQFGATCVVFYIIYMFTYFIFYYVLVKYFF